MSSVTIPRPNKKFKSSAGNYYIKHNGERVVLDKETVEVWDDLITLTIGEETFTTHSATPDDVASGKAKEAGELIEGGFTRKIVEDYTSIKRTETMKAFEVKMNMLDKEFMKPAAVEASVRNEVARAL